jgi:hypothetical protein
VHVTRPDGLTGASPAALAAQRRLAESLGGSYHQGVGENVPAALLTFARAENATQLVLGVSRRGWLAALLTGPGVSMRTIRGSGDIDVHIVTHAQMGRGRGLPRARGGLPLRRRLAGYAVAAVLAPLLTVVLASFRSELNLTSDVLAFLAAVIGVAVVGGFIPAVLEAVAGSLLLNYYFSPPLHRFTISEANNAAALAVFVLVGLVVSSVVDDAARRSKQAARATAESELLVTTAGSVLRGQQALTAVLDRVRESFGMESVTVRHGRAAGPDPGRQPPGHGRRRAARGADRRPGRRPGRETGQPGRGHRRRDPAHPHRVAPADRPAPAPGQAAQPAPAAPGGVGARLRGRRGQPAAVRGPAAPQAGTGPGPAALADHRARHGLPVPARP